MNVGYNVFDLPCSVSGELQPLTVAVWYPTDAQAHVYTYGGPTRGRVAVDGVPRSAGGPYPLLVFSHGYGGGGISAVFLAEALAARGWIVACADHRDRHTAIRIRGGQKADYDRIALLRHAKEIASSSLADRDKYLYRIKELRCVLDGMLASPTFGRLIDTNRIAVGGHSFGGFAALGLCGTLPRYHDPRIAGLLLFSSGSGGFFFEEEEFGRVGVPSMVLMGERERDKMRGFKTMAELTAKIYANLTAPKYFLEIRGANHFSFNDRFADYRSTEQPGGTEEQFAVIRRYAVAFLEKHVAGRDDAENVLWHQDPMITRYLRETD
jgi:predicted dienelactone hydrolase